MFDPAVKIQLILGFFTGKIKHKIKSGENGLMRKKAILFAAFVLFAVYSTVLGAGETSANFLKLSEGARPAGMGEAFVGVADDVNAVYWNPAGLSQLTRNQICLMHSAWLLDVNYEYLAYALPIQGFGTLAAYSVFVNGGSLTQTIEAPGTGDYELTTNSVTASDLDITLAYAKKLSDIIGNDSAVSDLSFGLSANLISEKIVSDGGGGFGFNIGSFFYPRYENYSVGFVAENLGVANNRPSLPVDLKLGFGYRFSMENLMLPFSDEGTFVYNENDTTAALDILYYPIEQSASVHLGAEKYWTLNKYHSIAVRLGYKFGEDLGALAGLTAGLGYRLTASKDLNIELDYVMVPYADLGVSNRISITGKFAGTSEKHFFEDKKAGIEAYKRGYDYLYKLDFGKAIPEFAECVKKYRGYAPAYMGLGACFLNTGRRELAYRAYSKALELDPGNAKLKAWLDQNQSMQNLPEAR